ncbi:response regulator [candidate division KSB1 bacterium]
MNELIAVLDDEPEVLELIEIHLKQAFYNVEVFEKAARFLDFIKENKPDLIILDLIMPDADGLEICKFIKSYPDLSDVPVIILTSKSDEPDRILGLELGADDYVTKPFFPKELAARVKTVLRRTKPGKKERIEKFTIGEKIEIDPQTYIVTVEGKKIDLTSTEFKILELLSSHLGRVYSRDYILDYLWGSDKIVIDRTVDVHVKNLRKKLGEAGKFIKNIRTVGYKIVPDE